MHALRHGFGWTLAALLSVGATTACGDDAVTLGAYGNDSGASGAGTNTGGGTGTGGASATDGRAGGGGTGGGCGECFRAIRCVPACGQTPLSVGCCACELPAFDDIACSRDAAADGIADAPPERGTLDGSNPDDCGECARAIRCVPACGQTPVSIGCCACTAPAFDDIQCVPDV
jgi:hypothetical protein